MQVTCHSELVSESNIITFSHGGERVRKFAFTLAEVLITLGIIGVVAAMTIPSLMHKYRNHVIESRIKQFYSQINQAIKLSTEELGETSGWDEVPKMEGSEEEYYENMLAWINKYLSPSIKNMGLKPCTSGTKGNYRSGCMYFANGSGVAIHNHVWFFYPDSSKIGKSGLCGKDFFAFSFFSDEGRVGPFYVDGLDVYLTAAGNYGCNKDNTHHCSGWLCTRLIEKNGWKIPKDYPY